jgi:hypothetical protein
LQFIEISNFRGNFETGSDSSFNKAHFASEPGRAQPAATRPRLAPFLHDFGDR